MQRLRKGLLLLIALALILGAVPSRSYATPALEGQYAFVVGTSSLNLRAGPGIQYDVLASAPRGAMVQILSYEGGNWRSVKVLSSDMVGFMDATYLGTAPESLVTPQPVYPIFPIYPTYPPSPSSTQAVVNNPVPTQFLNLRQSPSYTAPVLGIYYNGTICTVLSESGGWYYVEMTGGLRGYFRGEYLSFNPIVTPTPPPASLGTARIISSGGKVNLRQGPGYNYPVLASYYPGKIVTIYSKTGSFWQIAVDGLMGFMDKNYLQVIDGGTQGNATIKAGIGSLNLRAQPATTAKVLGSYKEGTAVQIKKQGLEWCQVSIPSNSASGYFMTKFLTLHNLPEIPTKVVKHPDGSYVNLRSLPSLTQGAVNMKMPHNSVVTILAPAGLWTRVRFGTVNGYVMSVFLK
jgi:N-acetylmuramoyl-L-alanine amidase